MTNSDNTTKSAVTKSRNVAKSAIVQPRISEKASRLSKSGKYVFVVASGVNKIEIRKSVESAYKVKVLRVNIVTMEGKNRTFGAVAGKTSGFKKAIVTLKKGDTIEGAVETV